MWITDFRHSHSHHVLHVEVLQRSHVRVVTFVILQDDLLDDAVQEEPVLHGVPIALTCRHIAYRGRTHTSVSSHDCHNTTAQTQNTPTPAVNITPQ